MRRNKIGKNTERSAELARSVRKLSLREQYICQVAMRLGIVRLNADRLLKLLRRFLGAPHLSQHCAQSIVPVVMIRLLLDRGIKMPQSFFSLPLLRKHHAEIQMSDKVILGRRNRMLKKRHAVAP